MIRNQNGLQAKFEGCSEVNPGSPRARPAVAFFAHNGCRSSWLFPPDVAHRLPPLYEGAPMKNPLDSLSATIALGLALTALLYAVAKVAMGA